MNERSFSMPQAAGARKSRRPTSPPPSPRPVPARAAPPRAEPAAPRAARARPASTAAADATGSRASGPRRDSRAAETVTSTTASASPTRVDSPAPRGRGDKRERILRAATHVFATRGFFNAQVADVARAAGIAAGTVYLYFRGKDDLLIAIFDRTMTDAIAEGRTALARARDPLARLRRIARLHLQRLGRDRDLAIVFQVELRQSTKFMEQFSRTQLREYLGIIRDAIADGQAAGLVRPEVDATLAAKCFFGALDEMATNWILSQRRYALVSMADRVCDLFVHGVTTPTHGSAKDHSA